MRSASKSLKILVTGTNQGLGKKLATRLLENHPESSFIFTTIKKPQQSHQDYTDLNSKHKNTNFHIRTLNLLQQESIQNLVRQVKDSNWAFDVIVNNAAMGYDEGTQIPEAKWAKALLKVNVNGTISLTNSLLPFLKDTGRIVNVSSRRGALKLFHPEHIAKFTNPNIQQSDILQAVEEYGSGCQQGNLNKWYKSVYSTSKMLINSWSRFVLKRKLKPGQVSICMSPGRCKTQMNKAGGVHTPESGAKAVYDCMMMERPEAEVFYHRWEKNNFIDCGPEVDREDQEDCDKEEDFKEEKVILDNPLRV